MKHKLSLFKTLTILTILVLSTSAAAGSAFAGSQESELVISLGYEIISCGDGEADVAFSISWEPAEADSYLYYVDFGDGDLPTGFVSSPEANITLTRSYIAQGEYEIYIEVFEEVEAGEEGGYGSLEYTLILEGPEVDLNSFPAPPVFVVGEDGEVTFTADTTGSYQPYTYEWDLGGGQTAQTFTSNTATATYTDVGRYKVETTVTDSCGFTSSASMSVVVADPEDVCHPTAQKIADAVSTLFSDQADQYYTCEDIYTIFDNPEGENNLGFGRMWMAYKLAESIDLTWEEILAWHMEQTGWGSLMQLNRFAEVLGDQGIGDLIALVMSEDYTLADVRTAVRSVTRFEADFDDALTRIADGASAGELSQFYRLAADLEADYETLDGYLADGMTLSEIKHAASLADRMEADWTEIADFRSLYGDSWGDLKQAYSLATDEFSAADILAMGIQEFRKDQRAEKTAEKLGEQYGADSSDVLDLFNGICEGKWSCVRKTLREGTLEATGGLTDKDFKIAAQIAAKYNSSESAVLAYYQGEGEMNWASTRAYFRDSYKATKETGKPDK